MDKCKSSCGHFGGLLRIADDLYRARERFRRHLLTIFCIIRAKFIALKKLRQKKSVMVSGGRDGRAPEGGNSGGRAPFAHARI